MWLFFGFITLISFSIYYGRKHYLASWSGQSASANGIEYEYDLSFKKSRASSLKIGIDDSVTLEFALKKESWLDRFFKAIGIAEEHQVGDAEFDEQIYVVSDDRHLFRLILRDPDIRQAVTEIKQHIETNVHKLKEIRNSNGRLWVNIKPNSSTKEEEITGLAPHIVERLEKIRNKMQSTMIAQSGSWKDFFAIKAAIILAISSGLAIHAVIHFLRWAYIEVPFIIKLAPVYKTAAISGGGIVLLLVILTFALLGRTARTHLVLIEILLIGSFGAVGTSFITLRDINFEFDQSETIQYETKLISKKKRRSRRSTSYSLTVTDWLNEGHRRRIRVDSSDYHRFNKGDRILIDQRAGYLGFGWVEKIH